MSHVGARLQGGHQGEQTSGSQAAQGPGHENASPPHTYPKHPNSKGPSLIPTAPHTHSFPPQPHSLAKDQLKLWTPASLALSQMGAPTISEAEHEHIKNTMLHAWEEDTCMAYGAGLLMWHCFCDKKGTSKEARALATQPLLSLFFAHLAAAYSGKTISSYMSRVQAWHILHRLPWALKTAKMDTML